MFLCNECNHTFHDTAGSWTNVDDRDELIEDAILKCPLCGSTDVGVADEEEEIDEPEYVRLREIFPNSLLDY